MVLLSLELSCFMNSRIQSVKFGNTPDSELKSLKSRGFESSALRRFVILSAVNSIDPRTLARLTCSSISLEENLHFMVEQSVLYSIDKPRLIPNFSSAGETRGLVQFESNSGVREIRDSAFQSFSKDSIYAPSSCEVIAEFPFESTGSLSSVSLAPIPI
jgi:hypothetical protein